MRFGNLLLIAVFLLLIAQTVSAKVTVQTQNCGIVYTLHFAFVGDGASDAFIQRVKDGISNFWNKDFTCGDCQCKAKVEVDARNMRGSTCADVPAGYDCITVIDTAAYHRSWAHKGQWGEDSHETDSGEGEWDTGDDESVLAHESGHYLGLEDEYEDNFEYYVKDAAGNVVSGPHYVRRAEYNDAKRDEIERSAPAGGSIGYTTAADGFLRVFGRPKAGYVGGDSLMYVTGGGAKAQQRHITEICRQAKASCGNECCCGNNKFEADKEECDPTANPNGCAHLFICTPKCQCAIPLPVCGNGKIEIQQGEKCDVNATVPNFGCDEGYFCSENCSCILKRAPICGDKVKEPGEQCDWSSADCPTDYKCNSQCKCERVPRCGDKIVDPGEQCDGSAAVCDTPNSQCTGACQCAPIPVCGNGQVEFPEHCESNSDCPTGKRCSECLCVSCTESWSCGDWGAWGDWGTCSEAGSQTRTRSRSCTDSNNCGTTTSRPEITQTETQSCTYAPTEQKPAYSEHEAALSGKISNLAYAGASETRDLTSTGGAYGYRILNIPSHATITVCVSASGALGFFYYPQYHYGFDFTDTTPGCTEVYNKNNWANGVLLHLGDPDPANVNVQITVALKPA